MYRWTVFLLLVCRPLLILFRGSSRVVKVEINAAHCRTANVKNKNQYKLPLRVTPFIFLIMDSTNRYPTEICTPGQVPFFFSLTHPQTQLFLSPVVAPFIRKRLRLDFPPNVYTNPSRMCDESEAHFEFNI